MELKNEKTESVIANIIKIRNDKRIGQAEMAEKLDISVPSYSRIESQSVSLTYDTLAKIANIFNMRVVDIITYPDILTASTNSPTKIMVELEISPDEFIRMGLKNKIIQILDK